MTVNAHTIEVEGLSHRFKIKGITSDKTCKKLTTM